MITNTARTELSPREREVAIFVGKGMTNAEIGRLLGIRQCTVADHLKVIFRITESERRVEVAVWACKQGWL